VEFHGTCETCLSAAKDHASRVINFLAEDFGVGRETIRVYFSGNRGYHLHVFDKRFDPLDPQARAEIAEYMRGSSLPPSQTIASTLRRKPPTGPQGAGWTRKITGYVSGQGENYQGTLRKLVSEAVSYQRAMVDSSVTTDIHRVFRLAGTLHGNTGMSKARVGSLEKFDPQEEPVVLSGKLVKVRVGFYPRFRMKHEDFGPFNKPAEVDLPTYAAVPILNRDLGEVV